MTATKPDVRLVTLTEENLGSVQMFCGHSPAYRQGYNAKMEWTRQRLKEGLRYSLLQVHGHNAGLIEYIPGEYAWRGVEAAGYLFIHCFWVIGQNRKHGYGRRLLEACLEDAKGTHGVVVMVSKTHWLPTPRIFLKNGFELADRTNPSFDLLVKRLDPEALLPRFKKVSYDVPGGLTLYHSHQCPYFQNSITIIEKVGEQLKLPVNIIQVDSAQAAQGSPCPYGTLGVFYEGELVTHRPVAPEKLLKLISPRLAGH
jgi:GNAT superfamily N-acetyltransferase